jgi:hypothetical protein
MKPQTQVLTMPPLDLRADVGAVNNDTRTVDLTFATAKADVLRYDWESGKRFFERLSLDPKHVRMDRLASGRAPLLDSHSAWSVANVIGVVESAALEAKRGVARVRFSKAEEDPEADRIYRKILDRIIQNVSIGYRVFRFEDLAEHRDGTPVRLAIDWEPFEISVVPMGADAGASLRRLSRDVETNSCQIVRDLAQTDADRVRLYEYLKAR